MTHTVTVSIPRAQYNAIQKLIKKHPEWGYDSPTQAIKDAIRQWLKQKKLEEKMLIIREENEFEID